MNTVFVFVCLIAIVLACGSDPSKNHENVTNKNSTSENSTPSTEFDYSEEERKALMLLSQLFELETFLSLSSIHISLKFNVTGYETAFKLPTVFIPTHHDNMVSFTGCQSEAFISEFNYTDYGCNVDLSVSFGVTVDPVAFFEQNGLHGYRILDRPNTYFFQGKSKVLMSQFIDQYATECLLSKPEMCFVNIDCSEKPCDVWMTARQYCKL